MKCQFCNQELPDKAKFCNKCKRQLICKECGEELLRDAEICVYCGTELSVSRNSNMNTIEYSRSENTENFTAKFSDITAANVVQTFAELRTPNIRTISQLQLTNASIVDDIEITSNTISCDVDNNSSLTPLKTPTDLENLNKIFINKGDTIILHEKRLKSKTALEQTYRLALLFILYKTLNTEEDVKRSDLNAIISKETLHLGNFRTWLSKNKNYFISTNSDVISLSPEGKERARAILAEVFDDSISTTWTQNTSKTSSVTNNKSTVSKSPKIVPDLNLIPKGEESLKDFMAKYDGQKSNPKNNLLFVYYLVKIRKMNNVDYNYIYTCYKEMGYPVPANMYQCIIDTIGKRKWLQNISSLETTIQGDNEVEHKMKKK